MKFKDLISKNIYYYARFYKLVAFAVAVTVAVIVGSLVVGDSVRETLVKRVDERLGKTETVIFSQNSFFENSVSESLGGRGILLSNGFVSQNGRLIPVMIWGVSDMSINTGEVKINERLSREIADIQGTDIALRLPATGLVPSGSLFVKDNYSTSLRLKLSGILGVDSGGNISLKNEQAIPFNIFINRTELSHALEIGNKINLILSENYITSEDLDKSWKHPDSGIKIALNNGVTEITSDRIFIQDQAVQTIIKSNPKPTNRLFSYLANSIEGKGSSIPYSFVTAADSYKGSLLRKDEIILSDYTAKRLKVGLNDTISISYFVSHDLKTLENDSAKFVIKEIVPISEFMADSTLSSDFPGLSDVERCTDWDSDLPIDMKLITKEDENYWETNRSTPKAIISYSAIEEAWSNSYGSATSIRIESPEVDMAELTPEMFGIQIMHPRLEALTAAKSGVDFSGLFLSLGFFIIVSAILLMLVPTSEMLSQRRREIELLKSLGFPRKRVINILWRESMPIVVTSSIAGAFIGILYTYATLLMLSSVWKGATHTEGFYLFPNIWTILGGLIFGLGISILLLRLAISRSMRNKRSATVKKTGSINNKRILAIFSSITLILLLVINLAFVRSVELFVLAGIIVISSAAFIGDYILHLKRSTRHPVLSDWKLIWATIYANRRQVILAFVTLAGGVFVVFSVGLNRKGFADSSEIATGTGGYALWCESSVPIYHSISTEEGRSKLALTDLPADAEVMQIMRYSADDASCLNLNKVSRPTVLGVDFNQIYNSSFGFEGHETKKFRTEMISAITTKIDSTYPVMVDATVLTWGLGMSIGDTLVYEGSKGQKTLLRIAGTLKNSIFQGNILIDKRFFTKIWDEIKGSEVMLVKVRESEVEITESLLSRALADYGVRVTKTSERLQDFYSVTDTYLTIFLTLGCIGLLLGIMSFIIVISKNLAARQSEIGVYRSLGFSEKQIGKILYQENIIVPLFAIATGVAGSLVGIASGFANVSIGIWILTLIMSLLFAAFIIIFVKRSVTKKLSEK